MGIENRTSSLHPACKFIASECKNRCNWVQETLQIVHEVQEMSQKNDRFHR